MGEKSVVPTAKNPSTKMLKSQNSSRKIANRHHLGSDDETDSMSRPNFDTFVASLRKRKRESKFV